MTNKLQVSVLCSTLHRFIFVNWSTQCSAFMIRSLPLLICMLVSCLAVTCVRDYPSTSPYKAPPVVSNPTSGGLPSQTQPSAQKRLYLDNDKIRLGIDLNAGGAITYLSESSSTINMVNNNDLGRQIQTSLYAGPYPYIISGKAPPPAQWINLGWNPVQTGDYYNHPAQVVSYQQSANSLYVKTIPLIWPLFNEPAECVFEHWIELKDNTVRVRCHIVVNRPDTTKYESRTQEVPCVYLNGPYYRIIGYTGTKPFTNDAVSEYSDYENINRYGTENWMALMNASGKGVGLYKPNEVRFSSARFGTTTNGGEYDVPSGYITSQPHVLLDHNGQYDFEYTLVMGTVNDIRQFAYSQPRPTQGPAFTFTNDRQGWYYHRTTDSGWPIKNELNVRWQRDDSTISRFRILSPTVCWQAANIGKLYVEAAFKTGGNVARLCWRKPDEIDFIDVPDRYIDFPVIGDGQYRTYEINTRQVNGWDNVIAQLSLTSPSSQYAYENGSMVRIRSVKYSN